MCYTFVDTVTYSVRSVKFLVAAPRSKPRRLLRTVLFPDNHIASPVTPFSHFHQQSGGKTCRLSKAVTDCALPFHQYAPAAQQRTRRPIRPFPPASVMCCLSPIYPSRERRCPHRHLLRPSPQRARAQARSTHRRRDFHPGMVPLPGTATQHWMTVTTFPPTARTIDRMILSPIYPLWTAD
jgi:hypothetical protein